jgi:siroheme synthase-like protein
MEPRVPQYPVNLVLDGVDCLVVGGGRVAARKCDGLLRCGARVTVVAPEIVPELRRDTRIACRARVYRDGEAASYRLVIAATGNPDVDGRVHADATAAGVPVNAADDPAHCTFTLPAIARIGDLQVTVSTNGRSPAFASWLRDRIERGLPAGALAAIELMNDVRREMIERGLGTERPGWREALDAGLVDLVAAGRTDDARRLLLRHLGIDAGS